VIETRAAEMLCPSCKNGNNKVIDSRLTEAGNAIRRRRICLSCERRFTTKERVEEELRLTVIKSGGQRVPYNRDNILRGVDRACSKLDIAEEELQALVDRVEEDLFANHDREVRTEQIGRYVGVHLRRLNPVAYVRFMSVHRKYSTIDEFIEEISDVRARVAEDSPTQRSLFDA
jgi:transcriptional repressor NrdR